MVAVPIAVGLQVPSACAAGSCFPYDGVNRIRFEGFGDWSRLYLSPALRALPNEVFVNKSRRAFFSNEISRSPCADGAARETRAARTHRFGENFRAVDGTLTA